jgi:alkanesulfonate monooxygenase SsuD/methylene tetrahydromethanopterin reductase-like flavin-dependent oxidoreductase (luciferase family)
MPPLSVGTLGAIMPPGANLVANAQRSEAKGFDAIWWPDYYMGWFPQSLWTPDITQLAAFQPNPHVFFDSVSAIAAVGTQTQRVRLGRSEALELLDRVPDAVAESATLHGTAEEVAEQLQDYHAAGLEHVVLWNVTFFADASLARSGYALVDRVRQLLTEARVA